MYRHKEGHNVYKALSTICDTPEQAKDTLRFVEGNITVHFTYKCTNATMREALQPLLDADLPVEHVTIVNSISEVPFVYKVKKEDF